MKKLILILFLISSIKIYSQNSINGGVDIILQNIGTMKLGFTPNLSYTLTMGEKFAFQPGIGFFMFNYKTNYELLDTNNHSVDKQHYVKYKTSGLSLYGDLKFYMGPMSNNEEGGLYGKIGIGIMPLKYSYNVEDFDTLMFRSDNGYIPGKSEPIKENVKNIRFALGYDREIADLLMIYIELGYNLHLSNNGGLYYGFNVGIRKIFFSL